MTIVKQLFLITAFGLGINTQLCASESQPLLSFADKLERLQTENSEPKTIAQWIRKTFSGTDEHSTQVTDQLNNIVESNNNPTQQAQAIREIYTKETTPQQQENTGYFSNISTRVKAAAALVIAASIASYFYFMRPWSTPSAQ